MAFTGSGVVTHKEGGSFSATAIVVHKPAHGTRAWSNAFGADFGPLAS